MHSGISFTLSNLERLRLEGLVADRSTQQKHVWRARIVLLGAVGLGTHAIMRGAGASKTVAWRWQDRFAQEGVSGILRNKTQPAHIPSLGQEVAARLVRSDARRSARQGPVLDGCRHEQGRGYHHLVSAADLARA